MKFKQAIIFYSILLAGMNLFALDVDVRDYGAVPDDGVSDDWKFRNAIIAIVNDGGGTLHVPAGVFDFAHRRQIDLKGSTVDIVGSGKGVTVLKCTNSSGIWWFRNTQNTNQLLISDLNVEAAAGGSAGTAFQINNPSLTSNAEICSLYMDRVGFVVEQVGVDYFFRHVFTTYLKNPVFIDVFVTSSGMTDSCESGFRINYGDGAYFENCYSKGNGSGWMLTNYKGGIVLNRCNAVANDTGIHITGIPAETCTVHLLGIHVNTEEKNVSIIDADQVCIENAASYVQDIQTPFTDFYILNSANVQIVGCEFHQPYDPYRTMIHLAGTTHDVSIKQNIFNGKYWGTGASSVINVLKDSGVANVTEFDNLDPPSHQW